MKGEMWGRAPLRANRSHPSLWTDRGRKGPSGALPFKPSTSYTFDTLYQSLINTFNSFLSAG